MEIKGHELEFFPDGHVYLVDGVILPSITQILSARFGGKYANVNKADLDRAAAAGTAVHAAVEAYVKTGAESDLPELRGFKFLQRSYGFDVVDCEVPVILFDGEDPVAAGRLDLVLRMNGELGGADIKRTATLDKDYLFYQLNLYRIAYAQSYGPEWSFLRGVQLREDKRKYVQIPINPDEAWGLVREYFAKEDK